MADPILILWEYLTESGNDLYTSVGTRVWCPIPPPSFDNTEPGLVYHPDDQAPEAPMNVLMSSIVFKCYGGSDSFSDARAIAEKLYGRLHMVSATTTSGQIVRVRCAHMSQMGADPDTGWPVHLARYEMITS